MLGMGGISQRGARRGGRRLVGSNTPPPGAGPKDPPGPRRPPASGPRALGDVLIVGLNDDASVRGYKGPDRPLVPDDERAELLAALHCVDYVVLFGDPTATRLVAALTPDVYVKGGDYSAGPGDAAGKP